MMRKILEVLPIDRFKVPKFFVLISMLAINMSLGVSIRFPEFGLSGYLSALARANNKQNFAILLCEGTIATGKKYKEFQFKKELQFPVAAQRDLLSEYESGLVISEAVKKILSAHQIKPHLPNPSFDESVNTIIPFFQTDSFWDEVQKELEVQAEE